MHFAKMVVLLKDGRQECWVRREGWIIYIESEGKSIKQTD